MQLLEAGEALGLKGRGLKLDLAQLQTARLPMILHWQFNHFVVLEGFARGRAQIVDPASGRIQADKEQLDRAFSGIALQFDVTPNLVRRRRRSEP